MVMCVNLNHNNNFKYEFSYHMKLGIHTVNM